MISAIISTYNREEFLPKLFESIQNQDFDNSQIEVIVIDNNSPGNTKELTKDFESKSDFIVKYFLEKEQGLSYARNRGIKESSGEIITFLDDDAFLEKNYFSKLNYYFSKEKTIKAIGSKILLHFECEIPKWENKYLNSILGYFNLGDEKKVLNKKDYPRGSNMTFKKEVFEQVGDFNVALGRVKSGLAGGEEKDLFMRVYAQKLKVVYVPDAIVYHRIPLERTSTNFVKRQAVGIGLSEKIRTSLMGRKYYVLCVIKEMFKWSASIILLFLFSFQMKFAKGIMIIRFRYWVTKGLISK